MYGLAAMLAAMMVNATQILSHIYMFSNRYHNKLWYNNG